MKIGETVKVPATEYVEVEVAGENYVRYSADRWDWLIGESTEVLGPNQMADLERAYQKQLSQQQWQEKAVEQQEQQVPIENTCNVCGNAWALPNMVDGVCPGCVEAMENEPASQELSQAHKDYADKTTTFDIQQELERLSVSLRGSGKTATIFNRVRFLRKVLIAKLAQVANKEPTRPSEDDMMSKPDLPGPYGEWSPEFQKRLEDNIEDAKAEGVYDQHPQFRDIGIRIDRYGKLVFKPELVE